MQENEANGENSDDVWALRSQIKDNIVKVF